MRVDSLLPGESGGEFPLKKKKKNGKIIQRWKPFPVEGREQRAIKWLQLNGPVASTFDW